MRAPILAGAPLVLLLAAAPALGQDEDPAATNPAYAAARGQQFILTPEMIKNLTEMYGRDQRARAAASPVANATPINRRINVRLTPGDPTPIVQAAIGYPTVLSFYDSTGQPWPVARHSNSNPSTEADPSGFTVERPVEDGNSIEITSRTPLPRGGLVVYLRGATKPLAFMVVAGTGSFDANAAIHVAGRGPNARMDVVVRADTPETGAPYMTEMLQGITPAGARPMTISGASANDFQAWKLGSNLYLRTTYTLVAPEPVAYEHAEGGLRVYSIRADRNGRVYDDTALRMSGEGRTFTVWVRGN